MGRAGLLLRWLVAAVFAVAAVGKVLDGPRAIESVAALQWVAPSLVTPLTVALVVIEGATALLLVLPRRQAAGALLGALLAALFAAITFVKIQQGTTESCACFGVFLALQPQEGLRLDLALLVSCLAILSWSAPAEEPVAPGGRYPGVALVLARFGPTVATYACLMLLLFRAGDARQAAVLARPLEAKELTLRYGQPAPAFESRTLAGEPISGATLRGRWALYLFASQQCATCEKQLVPLTQRYPHWRGRVEVVAVVRTGPGAMGLAQARRYATRLRLNMPVVADANGALSEAWCDRPTRWPFAVVVDPAGVVRFVTDGFRSGKMNLVSQVEAMLSDVPLEAALAHPDSFFYGRRLPEVPVDRVTPDGLVRESLKGTYLISFLTTTCGECTAHRRSLERAVGPSGLRAIWLYPPGTPLAGLRREVRVGELAVDTAGLTERFGLAPPQTFIVQEGRLVYRTNSRVHPHELRRLLGQSTKERQP